MILKYSEQLSIDDLKLRYDSFGTSQIEFS